MDQSQTNGNGGFGLGGGLPGGQLLSTALGVTRAVTQFLGTALQVKIIDTYIHKQTHCARTHFHTSKLICFYALCLYVRTTCLFLLSYQHVQFVLNKYLCNRLKL